MKMGHPNLSYQTLHLKIISSLMFLIASHPQPLNPKVMQEHAGTSDEASVMTNVHFLLGTACVL